ncbi:hypothetical protein FDF74_02765 [Clostridium niameyense]|uniref:Uncharacterized protein n=1 Tax=Clostridium niameyense TaxID=1622073 RepID=A0A6M0R7D4_9CLOT|nr:hypothetical protein [Clostridium niameyense]NEZ46132.1 hypothetical protein [Clostridium niameyense]
MKVNRLDKVNQILGLKEENEVLKFVLREYVSKSITYKDLLQKALELLERYQEKVEGLERRIDMWADETVRIYREKGDLDKALKAVGKEIRIYELNKNKGEM